MSALPSMVDVASWLSVMRDLRQSPGAQAAACSNVMVAYARAIARATGRDEGEAALMALEHVRQSQGEVAAYELARKQDIDLDRLREEDLADRQYMAREAEWEARGGR